jgi:hypothetical protein
MSNYAGDTFTSSIRTMNTNTNKNNSNNDDYEDDFENDTKFNTSVTSNNTNLNNNNNSNTANPNPNMNTKMENTPSNQPNVNTSNNNNSNNTNYFAASKQVAANANNPNNIANSAALQRASVEYQVAWELEMWRRTEQMKIEQQWKLSESKRMIELESEFKRAELQREAIHQSKVKEIATLEKKLQNALFDCQQHEKQLKFREQEFNTKSQLVNNEIGRKHEEAELAVKRMKEQLQHQNNIQKRITGDMQSQIDTLRSNLHVAEAKLKETEAIYLDYKSKISKSTIGELRMQLAEKELLIKSLNNEITKLSNDKSTLENRIGRCLDEIARLNGDAEDRERERIALERKDIQRMKMVYLAKQQSQGLRHDMEQLEDIRKDLQKFRQGAESNYLQFGDDIKQQQAAPIVEKVKRPSGPSVPFYVNNYTYLQPDNMEQQQQLNQENIQPNVYNNFKLFQQQHPALLTQQQQQQLDNKFRIDLSTGANNDQVSNSNANTNNLQPPRPNTSPRPTSPKSPKNRVISPKSTPKKSPKSNNKRPSPQPRPQTSAPTSPASSKSRPLHSHLHQQQPQHQLLQQSQSNQNNNDNYNNADEHHAVNDNNPNSDNNADNNERYVSNFAHEYKPQSPEKSVVHEVPMPTQDQIAALDYINTHPDDGVDDEDHNNPLIANRSAGGAISATARVRKGTAGTGVAAARAARLAAKEAGAKAREARLNRKPKYLQ